MEVKDEAWSSTDIDSDTSNDPDQFISLTDVNSDSDGSFILLNSPPKQSTPYRKHHTNSLQSCSVQNSNTRSHFERNISESYRIHNKEISVLNKFSKHSLMASTGKSLRGDFISDSSSDEDLPAMDSLRARLARKRQNIMAAPFLQEEPSEKNSVDLTKEEDPDTATSTLAHKSGSGSVTGSGEKQNSDPVNFSDSSGDEDEKQPLSSFLTSPNNRYYDNDMHVHVSEPLELDIELSSHKTKEDKHSNKLGEISIGSSLANHHSVETKDISVGQATVNPPSSCQPTEPKIRKKRTAEEMEENKKKAQEKKAERERIKQAREAEKQKRRIERESKKQFSLGSCLKFVKVLVDTHMMNTPGFGAVLFKACEELGVTCLTEQLVIPYTIMWKRETTECSMSADSQVETIQNEIIENEVLAIVPMVDFIQMVFNFKQKQKGISTDGVTLRSYVNTVKSQLTDKSVTIVAQGIEQYFRDMKNQDKRQHREAVLSTDPNCVPSKKNKQKSRMLKVSKVDIEEAVTDTQLQTGCCTFMPETQEDVADLVRRFTKAVAERPAKKDRFDPVFSFHEEGSAGVKVDRSGHGLLKVWKQQLLQFKNVSPDVAQALITEYPSPQLLRQAYLKCSSEKEAVRLLENIVVRRGAGVLETTRRIGKELSRRIYTFLTSDDPNLVIK